MIEFSYMPRAFIGCSGFSYQHWRGVFYPQGLAMGKWLGYYAEKFGTVELNVTFYRLPQEGAFKKWASETPQDFCIALKGSRFITHIRRLREPEEALQRLMERAGLLGRKLSVFLWQLPPGFKADPGRLEGFLKALGPYRRYRHTFEFREASWISPRVEELLRQHNAAFCMADWPPFVDELPLTADFVYIRRHGRGGSYSSCYSSEELKADARRIRGYLRKGKDVYIYFNNDAFGYAPQNALELKRLLKA